MARQAFRGLGGPQTSVKPNTDRLAAKAFAFRVCIPAESQGRARTSICMIALENGAAYFRGFTEQYPRACLLSHAKLCEVEGRSEREHAQHAMKLSCGAPTRPPVELHTTMLTGRRCALGPETLHGRTWSTSPGIAHESTLLHTTPLCKPTLLVRAVYVLVSNADLWPPLRTLPVDTRYGAARHTDTTPSEPLSRS